MPRPLALALAATLFAGCDAAPSETDPLSDLVIVSKDATDNPLADLTAEQAEVFTTGDAAFEAVFRPTEGLGPIYIRHSCQSCHADDAKGPGAVRKMAITLDGATPESDQSALAFGHTVRPQTAVEDAVGYDAPADVEHLKETKRIGPAVFGRGYLEAIADDEIERMADAQQSRDDGISGRVSYVPYQSEANPETLFHSHAPGDEGLIGRFGLKARIASLDEFAADAYQGDMGITSPMRPFELPNPADLDDDDKPGVDIDLATVNAAADYVRLLAIPKREGLSEAGAAVFAEVRCAVCHVPSLRTRADYPIPQLADVDAPVFTDMLLHDMGDDLADAIVEHEASGREWRTAPLMGLRHLRSYLHDGRADTLEDAIELHEGPGSEANDSVARYRALSDADRAALLDYLAAL